MEMAGNRSLAEFLDTNVPDWEDDVVASARFKAFTGQRQDWESRYQFWKRLVVSAARHLDVIMIEPNEVQQKWFARNGLLPLGMETVLIEMLKSGELRSSEEFMREAPSNVRWALTQLARAAIWVGRAAVGTPASGEISISQKKLIVTELLQEKAEQVVKVLRDSQWSTTCVVTISRFVELCGGRDAAMVIRHHLLLQKRAQCLQIEGDDKIEGLKVALTQQPVAKATDNDLHLLQLYWTKEKLQHQTDVLDNQVAKSKNSAALAAKTGERQKALRHLRCMKLAVASRETCAGFLERINEVLTVISDAETTKTVTKAMQVGSTAIKEHHVTLEELHECLDDVAETVAHQKQLEEAFGTSLTTIDTADAAFEQELAALEAEVHSKSDEHRFSTMEPETELPSTAAANTGPEPAPASATEPSPETSGADDDDFARELAELEADLDSSPGRVSPKRTTRAQAGSSSTPLNPGVTVHRGSQAATFAGDVRQKESEMFEKEFSKLRIALEPA